MANTSTLEMTREQWLAERANTIGSSDLGTILGINQYETPRMLYEIKKGIKPPFEGNDSTEWGLELEDFMTKMFVKKNPEVGGRVQRDNKIRRNAEYPWATCNLDRLIVGGAMPIILELKTTTSFAVKAWDAAIPTSYYAQLQWQMFVTGYRKAIIWVGILDQKKFMRLDVNYSQEFMDAALKEVDGFRNALLLDDPSTLPVDVKDVELMRPDAGSKVEATPEVLAKVTQYTELKAKESESKKSAETVGNEIKLFIGNNELLVEGERIIAKYGTKHRDAYVVEAGDYRTLNIQREKKGKK